MLQLPHKTARFQSEAADLGPSSLACRNSESWWCAMLKRWLGLSLASVVRAEISFFQFSALASVLL